MVHHMDACNPDDEAAKGFRLRIWKNDIGGNALPGIYWLMFENICTHPGLNNYMHGVEINHRWA